MATEPLDVSDSDFGDPTIARETLAALATEIMARREAATRGRLKLTVRHLPRASDQGECAREMLLSIKHWDQRPQFSTRTGEIMERGHQIEERIISPELAQMGFTVVAAQMQLAVKDASGRPIITGHIDGLLDFRGHKWLFDCKTVGENVFDRMHDAADLWRMKWYRKWIRQMLVYAHAYDEAGAFLLIDSRGHWKIIPVIIADWLDELEAVLARCTLVVDALESKGDVPFHGDPRVCKECWAMEAGVCSPPLDFSGTAIRVVADQDIIDGLVRLLEIEDTGREYAKLDADIKAYFKARGPGEYVCGEHAVTVEHRQMTKYDVPDDVKAQFRRVDPAGQTRVTWE